MTAPSPLCPTSDIVSFEIKIDGQPLDDTSRVVSLQVASAANRIPSARIEILDGDAAAGGFRQADSLVFNSGNLVEISAGYRSHNQLLFRGHIAKTGLRQAAGRPPLLIVECRHAAGAMTVERRSAFFARQTDAEILRRIILSHGLSARIAETATRLTGVTQFRSTDWDFVVARAAASGGAVLSRPDTLVVAAPDTSPTPVLALTYGVDVLDFTLDKSGGAGSTPSGIRGTLRFQGSSLPSPGDTISLAGFGRRFDGNVWLGGVRHEIRDGQWTTEVSLGLDPAGLTGIDERETPAEKALPGISGLLAGTVKQIDSDPAGEFRVLVVVPPLDPLGEGIWARLAQPYATDKAGISFMPEVGDEVAVAFFDSDPSQPAIVGSLSSAAHPPAFAPDASNTHKSIVTKGGLKVVFDDVRKCLAITTPANNRLELSDHAQTITIADQNANSIQLTSGGITIASQSRLTLRGAGGISLESTAGSLLINNQGGDVTVNGLNVALSARAAFEAKGDARASLSSSGATTVKGGMVFIN